MCVTWAKPSSLTRRTAGTTATPRSMEEGSISGCPTRAWKVEVSPYWAEIRAEFGKCISFQQVEAYTPPTWPTQEAPQQMHLDVIVDDLDAAQAAVLDLGATKHEHQPGTSFRVFIDPAGHPFCLCLD